MSANRINLYHAISHQLSKLSDQEILDLINTRHKIHDGIGGASYKINIDGIDVFVKLVPLTDLERKKENMYSTKNIFNLPLYYQYGVGSTGFGAWRELASTKACSNWVINRSCGNFPILYGHRVLKDNNNLLRFERANIQEHTEYWESNPAIKDRYSQILESQYMLIMFLEYIPYNLHNHISDVLIKDIKKAEKFTDKILKELIATSKFMFAQGMVHFDCHFHNILTDGNDIYYADHGLALSKDFELTSDELKFLNEHKNIDHCFSIVNLLHCLTTSILGKNSWENTLLDIEQNKPLSSKLPNFIILLIKQYGDMAVIMDRFYKQLQKTSKSTSYPNSKLGQLISQN